MKWILKKIRSICIQKSKIFVTIISFVAGYLCHMSLSSNERKDVAILGKQFSSYLVDYRDTDVLLVVLIFSSVNKFNTRNTLRETWLSDLPISNDLRFYFVISLGSADELQKKKISEEQQKHKDLLIFHNLEDSFYLLTWKLVASFGWLTDTPVLQDKGASKTEKLFGNFRFVLKCDDDSFVRLQEVLQELKTTYSGSNGKNLYWGFFDGRARAKKTGKYKDQWNICDHYLPYALGGGYILAKPLVAYIAKNGDYLKKYKSEDITVGAWLSSYADLNRVHDPRFDTEYISRGCHQSYLITHKHSEVALRNFHDNLKNTGHLCKKEFKTRMSYIYNWDVVPSKCCSRLNPNIP